MKQVRKILFILLLAVLSLSLASANADSDAASVNGTGYATVQAAIDAAQAGDTVKLERDVMESVSITKNLTLDLAGCLFQAPAKGRAVQASGCELTIIDSVPDTPHKDVPTSYPDEWGVSYKDLTGGVFCGFTGKSASGANLDGCVHMTNGKLTMTGGTFYGNYTIHNGGAVYVGEGVTALFEGVDFFGNIGETHGGALHETGTATDVTIKDCLFDGNIGYRGGAIKTQYANSITISGSTIINNESWETGGGVHLDHMLYVDIEESSFHDNTSWGNGGGIYLHTTDNVILNKVNCDNNTTTNMNGGGLFCWGNEKLVTQEMTITDCTFNGNQTKTTNGNGSGGGLVFQDSNVVMKNTQVNNNVAKNSRGGGIAIWSTSFDEGGTFLIENCEIKNNTAGTTGGGIMLKNNTSYKATVTINNTVIEGNTAASSGGGIFTNPLTSLVIGKNTKIINNISGASGGGMAILSCDTILNECLISGNETTGNGGGIVIQTSNVTLNEGCTIKENNATSAGGGVAVLKSATLHMQEGSKIFNNYADAAAADLAIAKYEDSFAYLNEAKNFNEKFRDTGIRIDGWYLDNTSARYTQETGVEESGRSFNNQTKTLIAAIGKEARTYHVTYQTSGDAVYGLPDDYIEPIDSTKYNLNDLVTVVQVPTTSCTYATVGGRKVSGKWTFTSWSTTDFNISKDTVITGAWKFTADIPATGDASKIGLYGAMLLVSLAALLWVGLKKKTKNTRA